MKLNITRWIESDLDKNAWFYAEFKGSLNATCRFLNYILDDKERFGLEGDDRLFLCAMRDSYYKIEQLSDEMNREISKYKNAFAEIFVREE